MASLVKRPNGVYYLQVSEGGKIRRRSLETRSKAEARAKLRRIESAMLRQDDDVEEIRLLEEGPFCNDFWDSYCVYLERNYRPKTCEARYWAWKHFLQRLNNPKRLGDVTTAQVERAKAEWDLANTSWNDWLRGIKTIYNHAITLHLREDGPWWPDGRNPFVGVKPMPEPRGIKRALVQEQIDTLITAAQTHESQMWSAEGIPIVFALGGYAGLRKKEISFARWEWIDFERSIVTVYSGDNGFQTKNTKSRQLPLFNSLRAVLEPRRKPSGWIIAPETEPRKGHEYRVEFRRAFSAVTKRAQLDWVKVSKWMGHGSIKVTVDMCGHLQHDTADLDVFD